PLRNGSRFGRRHERGIFYGSETPRTAFAEVAYYRLLLLEGTNAALSPLTVVLSAFQVGLAAMRAVDLSRGPFARHQGAISSKTSYSASQALGGEMREAGVDLFRY